MQLLFWLSSKRLLILSHSIVFGALRCHCSYDIHTISISDMIQLSHQPGGWIYVDLRELLKLTTLSWCSSLAEKVLSRKALFNFSQISQISQIQTFSKASRKIYTCCEICWISFDTKLLNLFMNILCKNRYYCGSHSPVQLFRCRRGDNGSVYACFILAPMMQSHFIKELPVLSLACSTPI